MFKKLTIDEETILNNFRKNKVMTLQQLTQMLGCCERTTKRRIKKWQTHNSYNFNGRYYALPDIPRFNEVGLWNYRDACFSRHGNLKETVIHFVNHSEAGYSARELEESLGLKKDYCLSYFRSIEQLRIEKLGSRHIYFSSDDNTYERQKEKRLSRIEREQLIKLPSNANAVLILVEIIKHPGLTIDQLARRLRRKGHLVSVESIHHLFVHHGLLKKTAHGIL